MQKIGHDFLGYGCFWAEEFWADVQVEDRFAIIEFGNGGVDGGEFFADWGRFFASWENAEEKNFGFWSLFTDGSDDF